MLDMLRIHDPGIVELKSGRGTVLIPPSLCGRIFCQMDGELLHRLDAAAMLNPSPTEYDNLGGNSLWPAPEGGAFAFNYAPDSDAWKVQDGVAKVVPAVEQMDEDSALVRKRMILINKQGKKIDLGYRRIVRVSEKPDALNEYRVDWLNYRTDDIFEPFGKYSSQDVLLAPWSLEQFPGSDGIVAFGKVQEARDALNLDFYGDPGDRIMWDDNCFIFRLGGEDRHQIGIRVKSGPELIGAFDEKRSLLIIRKTEPMEGIYFNIADNAQASGPFSAADMFSIFNGGGLGFYELETIGAMKTVDGLLTTMVLSSDTLILRGKPDELLRYLAEVESIRVGKR